MECKKLKKKKRNKKEFANKTKTKVITKGDLTNEIKNNKYDRKL